MAVYEILPTMILAKKNSLVSAVEHLPELVHLQDNAKSVLINFSKSSPVMVDPKTPIDTAIHIMKTHHQHLLLVENQGQIIGLISFEDILSEKPILLMHEKRLNRGEITVDMLMQPQEKILVMDSNYLKNAQVGHIVNTIRELGVYYILVIKRLKNDKHLIKGLFSAPQIGKQLHLDLSSIPLKMPESIVELHQERRK